MTREVPWESVLESVLSSIFISDIDSSIKSSPSKFIGNTFERCGCIPKGWHATKEDPDELKMWARVNFRRLNKAKYKVLHLGWDYPWLSMLAGR